MIADPSARDRIKARIKLDEGTGPTVRGRYLPYRDTVGKITIGYGRNLTDRGLSVAEVELLFNNDIDDCIRDCVAAFPWFMALDDVRQGVLINMAFNLGITKLLRFKTTLGHIAEGRYGEAAVTMLESKWASQVGIRALRLAESMRSGEWA